MDAAVLHGSTSDFPEQLVTAIGTIFAVITSIVSIVVSIIALRMQREHDRKSVLPIPQIDVGDYVESIYVKLHNAGVGPMIVRNVAVTDRESGRKAHSIIALMPKLPAHVFWTTFVDNITDRAVPAQTSLTLLEFSGGSADEVDPTTAWLNVQAIRRELGILSIAVEVTDVYGTKLSCARDLDWFKRGEEPQQPLRPQ